MTDPRDKLIENLTALLAQTPDSYADKDWRQRRRALLDEVGRWKEGRDQLVRTSIRFYESEGHEVTARALREAKAPGRLFKAQKLDDQVEYLAPPGPDTPRKEERAGVVESVGPVGTGMAEKGRGMAEKIADLMELYR